jgi:hypothetical protein
MELTEEDVLEILRLFEQSKFDFLQLEQGERKITVSKSGYVTGAPAAVAPPPAFAGSANPASPPGPAATADERAPRPRPRTRLM